MPRSTPAIRFETVADLLSQLGGISPERVRLDPLPGKATERDLVRLNDHTGRFYELVDGTLVEKASGVGESFLRCDLVYLLGKFLDEQDLGALAGPDGTMRLVPGLVRAPDISFVSWARMPNGEIPLEPIPDLAPDLAIELLSEGNTPREMERKLKEYFLSETRLVWFVNLRKRTVEVFTAPDRSTLFTEEQTLDGGDVLPGLTLPVREVFAKVPRPEPKKTKARRKT